MGFTQADAECYVATVRWKFASTMPDWPHEYTVKSWRPDLADDFEQFSRLVLDSGIQRPWPPPPAAPIHHNHYLVVGEHEYWAMGPLGDSDPVQDKTVINRALLARTGAR